MVHPPSRGIDTPPAAERGVSLVEAVVAAGVVITMTAGLAHLLVWTRSVAWTTGASSAAVVMAVQKMEQLRSLPWGVDPAGLVSDTTTDLAPATPAAAGTGLEPSPPGVLTENTSRFVDFVDAHGQWCGTGVTPPPCAAFVRRWAIEPYSQDPAETLVLTVVVQGVADVARPPGSTVRAARVQTLKTRVVQ